MERYGVRSVPVCNNKGEVIGLIEARELLAEALALRSLIKKRISLRFKLADIGNQPITVKPNTTVKEAIKIMADNNIGFLPIVEDSKLVGVFSERDAIKAIATITDLNTPVIEYATKNPITVHPGITVKEAIEIMLRHNIRHLVGVENGIPKYVISVRDILKLIG